MPSPTAHRPGTLPLKKTGLAVFFLAGLATASIASLVFSDRYQAGLRPLIERHDELLTELSQSVNQQFGHLSSLVFLMRHDEGLARALASDRPIDRGHLHERFAVFSQTSSLISQVRWLDDRGYEQARMNITDHQRLTVAEEDLQFKGDRYYFQDAQSLAANNVYFSKLDLNIESGEIVKPLTPTVRALVRTGDQGKMRDGFLVINFSFQDLFSYIRNMNTPAIQVGLVNHEGYWLVHADPSREWGFMTGRPDLHLPKIVPWLWQRIQQKTTLLGQEQNGALWSFAKFTSERIGGRDTSELGDLYFVMRTPSATLAELKREALMPVLLTAALVYVLLGFGLFLFLHEHRARQALIRALSKEEQDLREANQALREALTIQQTLQDELVETRKLSSLGLMVAGVAHELNTPTGGSLVALSTLDALLDSLGSQVKNGTLTVEEMNRFLARGKQGLEIARQNTQRSAELIKSFKRLAVDRNESEPTWFELQQCMGDLERTLRPRLKNSRAELAFSVPEVRLFSHPGILSQVIQNLIENALDHAFPDNRPGVIEVSGSLHGEKVEFSVNDNGAGFSEDTRDQLFDPFFTTGRSQGNSGLGLHLVQQWVTRSLQGSLQAQSSPGRGSCFTISIPLVLDSAPRAARANS